MKVPLPVGSGVRISPLSLLACRKRQLNWGRGCSTMVVFVSQEEGRGFDPTLPCLRKVAHSHEGDDLHLPVLHNWIIKGSAMCYHVCVIMNGKNPQRLFVKSRHCVLVAGFFLSLHSLHVLNRGC